MGGILHRSHTGRFWSCFLVTVILAAWVASLVQASGQIPPEGDLKAYLGKLEEGNLLPNPDFEEPDPNVPKWPAEWEPTLNVMDFNQPVWDTKTVLSGDYSIRMSAPMDTEAAWKSARVPVKPETTYRFTGYVRTQDLTPQKARFHGTFLVQLYSGDRVLFPRPTKAGPTLEGTHDWTQVQFTFKTSKRADAVQVIAALASLGRAKGHVWFDAVKLEEVPEE